MDCQEVSRDHPDLVRRPVLHASAYTQGDAAKEVQMRVGHVARQRKWREASMALLGFVMSPSRFGRITTAIASLMMSLMASDDPSDLIVTVEAEDQHDFRDRLAEIKAPTLVIAGAEDPFYTEALLRDTTAGIPNARILLNEGKGHARTGKQFGEDMFAFLKEGMPEEA